MKNNNDDIITCIDGKPLKGKTKKIFFKCDRRKCDVCMAFIDDNECQHTTDIRHAKNFEVHGDVFVEKWYPPSKKMGQKWSMGERGKGEDIS